MTDDPRPRIYERLAMRPYEQCVKKPAKSRIEWLFWVAVAALLWIFANNI